MVNACNILVQTLRNVYKCAYMRAQKPLDCPVLLHYWRACAHTGYIKWIHQMHHKWTTAGIVVGVPSPLPRPDGEVMAGEAQAQVVRRVSQLPATADACA